MIPKISVIVPIYNVEPYLEKCVDSIRRQTLREIEIILVDDGSPDGCPQMCDQYAREDERIRVIHQKNAGVSAARNAGIRTALGEYAAFVDPDDWVDPDYLSIMLEHMASGCLVACNLVHERGIAAKAVLPAENPKEYETVVFNQMEAQISVMCRNGEQNIHSGPFCKLYDRRLLEEHQVMFCEDLVYTEDELFVIQYLSYVISKVVWVKAVTYHYRDHPQSAVNQMIRRYEKFDPKIFSESTAVNREFQYIGRTQDILRCYSARQVFAKKTLLLIMEMNGWTNLPDYKLYLRDIRAGLFQYLKFREAPLGVRVSAVLCAVHPKLDYLFFKMYSFISEYFGRGEKWKK